MSNFRKHTSFTKGMHSQKGFTLVEAIVTLVVVAIIAAITVVSLVPMWQTYKATERQDNAENLYMSMNNAFVNIKSDGRLGQGDAAADNTFLKVYQENIDNAWTDEKPSTEDTGVIAVSGDDAAEIISYIDDSTGYQASMVGFQHVVGSTGHYVVELNPTTGYVYGVFYSEVVDFSGSDGKARYEEASKVRDDTSALGNMNIAYYGGTIVNTFDEDDVVLQVGYFEFSDKLSDGSAALYDADYYPITVNAEEKTATVGSKVSSLVIDTTDPASNIADTAYGVLVIPDAEGDTWTPDNAYLYDTKTVTSNGKSYKFYSLKTNIITDTYETTSSLTSVLSSLSSTASVSKLAATTSTLSKWSVKAVGQTFQFDVNQNFAATTTYYQSAYGLTTAKALTSLTKPSSWEIRTAKQMQHIGQPYGQTSGASKYVSGNAFNQTHNIEINASADYRDTGTDTTAGWVPIGADTSVSGEAARAFSSSFSGATTTGTGASAVTRQYTVTLGSNFTFARAAVSTSDLFTDGNTGNWGYCEGIFGAVSGTVGNLSVTVNANTTVSPMLTKADGDKSSSYGLVAGSVLNGGTLSNTSLSLGANAKLTLAAGAVANTNYQYLGTFAGGNIGTISAPSISIAAGADLEVDGSSDSTATRWRSMVGGLVGYNASYNGSTGALTSPSVTGSGSLYVGNETGSGDTFVGGLVGYQVSAVSNLSVDFDSVTLSVNAENSGSNKAFAGGLYGDSGSALSYVSITDNAEVSVSAQTTSGFAYAGGLTGIADSTISGSTATVADINVSSEATSGSGRAFAGGLVGSIGNNVTNSTFTASGDAIITAQSATSDANAGGLIGYMTSGVASSDSVALNGDVNEISSASAGQAWSSAGGVVGRMNSNSSKLQNVDISTVSSSSFGVTAKNTASASDARAYAGGLVGLTFGTVTNSAPVAIDGTVEITAQNSGQLYTCAGGLIGYADKDASSLTLDVTGAIDVESYNTGSGSAYAGGVVAFAGSGAKLSSIATTTSGALAVTSTANSNVSRAGGVVGEADADMTNCNFSAANDSQTITVKASSTSESATAGMLVGFAKNGTIKNTVSGLKSVTIDNSTASVSASSNITETKGGDGYVEKTAAAGGVAGYTYQETVSYPTVLIQNDAILNIGNTDASTMRVGAVLGYHRQGTVTFGDSSESMTNAAVQVLCKEGEKSSDRLEQINLYQNHASQQYFCGDDGIGISTIVCDHNKDISTGTPLVGTTNTYLNGLIDHSGKDKVTEYFKQMYPYEKLVSNFSVGYFEFGSSDGAYTYYDKYAYTFDISGTNALEDDLKKNADDNPASNIAFAGYGALVLSDYASNWYSSLSDTDKAQYSTTTMSVTKDGATYTFYPFASKLLDTVNVTNGDTTTELYINQNFATAVDTKALGSTFEIRTGDQMQRIGTPYSDADGTMTVSDTYLSADFDQTHNIEIGTAKSYAGWTPIGLTDTDCSYFKGTFDGMTDSQKYSISLGKYFKFETCGYSTSGLSFEDGRSTSSNKIRWENFEGIFAGVGGSTSEVNNVRLVINAGFENSVFTASGSDEESSAAFGLLAGALVNEGTISNASIEVAENVKASLEAPAITTNKSFSLGTIVGTIQGGTVEGTSFTLNKGATLTVDASNAIATSDKFAGGIVGCIPANYTYSQSALNCEVDSPTFNGTGTLSVVAKNTEGDASTNCPNCTTYAGGLVGYAIGRDTVTLDWSDVNLGSVKLDWITSMAKTATAYAGGLIGYKDGSLNNVKLTSNAGSGHIQANGVSFTDSVSKAYAGGIAGYVSGSSSNVQFILDNAAQWGVNANTNYADGYMGGIFGYIGGALDSPQLVVEKTDSSVTGVTKLNIRTVSSYEPNLQGYAENIKSGAIVGYHAGTATFGTGDNAAVQVLCGANEKASDRNEQINVYGASSANVICGNGDTDNTIYNGAEHGMLNAHLEGMDDSMLEESVEKTKGTMTATYNQLYPRMYTVSFENNGHGDETDTRLVNPGETTESVTLEAEGYTFEGWFTDSALTAEWSFDTPISKSIVDTNGNLTLYAKWTEHTKDLTYDANEGAFSGGATTETATMTYSDSTAITSSVPVRDGYIFLGWATSDTATEAEYTAGDIYKNENVDPTDSTKIPSYMLYAVWKENAHTLTLYNGTDRKDVIAASSVSNDETSTYPDPDSKLSNFLKMKSAKTLDGWYTANEDGTPGVKVLNADGTIADGASDVDGYTSDGKFHMTEDKVLYACWETDEAYELMNANGGLSELMIDGGEYILANRGSAGTAYVVYQANSTDSNLSEATVTVNAADANHSVPYIKVTDKTYVWAAEAFNDTQDANGYRYTDSGSYVYLTSAKFYTKGSDNNMYLADDNKDSSGEGTGTFYNSLTTKANVAGVSGYETDRSTTIGNPAQSHSIGRLAWQVTSDNGLHNSTYNGYWAKDGNTHFGSYSNINTSSPFMTLTNTQGSNKVYVYKKVGGKTLIGEDIDNLLTLSNSESGTAVTETYFGMNGTATLTGYSQPSSTTGKTLAGWYTSGGTKVLNADGSIASNVSGYTDSDVFAVSGSKQTLYALWTEELKDADLSGLKDIVYDGTDTSLQQAPVVKNAAGDTLIEGTDYTISYSTDTKNVGQVTVTVTGKGKYTGTATGTYQITKRSITLVSGGDNKVYDGTALTSTTVTGAEGAAIDSVFASEVSSLSATGSVTHVAQSKVTNTISYTMKSGFSADNYEITKTEGELYVTAAPLSVTTPDANKTYDGTALTAEGSISGFVNSETATFTTTGSQTAVGNSENTYSINWNGTAKQSDYSITEDLGTLTVTESTEEITVTTVGGTQTYDGTALSGSVTVSTLPKGYTLAEATTGVSVTHVADGEKTVTVKSLVIKNAQGEDVTSKLNIKKVETATVKINPATLTVTTPTESKVYDGDALTASGSVSGLQNGETVSFETTGTQTAVGNSKNTYTLTFNKTAAQSDYTVSESVGTLTVTEYADQIDVTTAGGSKTYDGTALSGSVTVSTLPKGYTLVEATTDVSVTHVADGEKTVTVKSLVIKNAAGEDVTSKLNIKKTETATVKVTPATLTVTTPSDEKVYDGSALTAEGSVSGFVNDETATFTTTGTQTQVGSSTNTYDITWNGSATDSDYTISATLGTLKVYYAVTFDANGGDGSMEEHKCYSAGESYTMPDGSTSFTRENYTFDGWATEEGGDLVYTVGTTININENMTLYAHWKENGHTLTLYNGTTDGNQDIIANSKVVNDTKAEYPDNGTKKLSDFLAMKSQVTLDGWYTKNDDGTPGTKVLAADGTIVAAVAGYTTTDTSGNYVFNMSEDKELYACWGSSEDAYVLVDDDDQFEEGGSYLLTDSAGPTSGTTTGNIVYLNSDGTYLSTSTVTINAAAGIYDTPYILESDVNDNEVWIAESYSKTSPSLTGYFELYNKSYGNTKHLADNNNYDGSWWTYYYCTNIADDDAYDPLIYPIQYGRLAWQLRSNHKLCCYVSNNTGYSQTFAGIIASRTHALYASSDSSDYSTYVYKKVSGKSLDREDVTNTLTLSNSESGTTVTETHFGMNGYSTLTGYKQPESTSGKKLQGWFTGENGTGTKILNADGSIDANATGYTSDNSFDVSGAKTLYAYWTTVQSKKIYVEVSAVEDKNSYIITAKPSSSNYYALTNNNSSIAATQQTVSSASGYYTDEACTNPLSASYIETLSGTAANELWKFSGSSTSTLLNNSKYLYASTSGGGSATLSLNGDTSRSWTIGTNTISYSSGSGWSRQTYYLYYNNGNFALSNRYSDTIHIFEEQTVYYYK